MTKLIAGIATMDYTGLIYSCSNNNPDHVRFYSETVRLMPVQKSPQEVVYVRKVLSPPKLGLVVSFLKCSQQILEQTSRYQY